MTRICAYHQCRREFIPRQNAQRFCSQECRNKNRCWQFPNRRHKGKRITLNPNIGGCARAIVRGHQRYEAHAAEIEEALREQTMAFRPVNYRTDRYGIAPSFVYSRDGAE